MEIIHIVLGKANPSRMNGVNKVVNELATRQCASGEKVSLWGITRFTRHDYPDRIYPTLLFKAFKNPFRLDKALYQALDTKQKGVVFHIHGGFIPAFYTLAMALRRRKIPFFYTPHGSYNIIAMQRSHLLKKWYFRFFEKKILEEAQAIHCLGKSETVGLKKIFPNKKTALIPYGFETPSSLALPVYRGRFVVGFCGRLDIYTKGLDLLLKAFALLIEKVPGAELWIIGDSSSRTTLEIQALQLGIRYKTTFYGSRFDLEKVEILGNLHVFAHPSRNEGLPTAVLEAASLGIPCVITEATNLGDSVRQWGCGEVIGEPDAVLLSQALLRMYARIERGDLSLLSANSRRMVREGYNWSTVVRNFRELYARA